MNVLTLSLSISLYICPQMDGGGRTRSQGATQPNPSHQGRMCIIIMCLSIPINYAVCSV